MMETKPLSRIVLGLTGGIAAYKSAELTRLFVKAGVTVDVCMTAAACRFIAPLTLQALSGRPVVTDLWATGADNGMGHIDLSRGADAIVVAPASADFLAKIANGHADDLLTTLTLARDCALFVAPAMNRQMWANAANQRNVARLVADGVIVLGPGSGDQACGETGDGRMLEPEEIFAAMYAWAQPKLLAGKRVLLTAGPTFEPIDPVRGITNTSSGKMGFALAQAAAEAGAAVTLVSGPTSLPTPAGVTRIDVTTAADMATAVDANLHGIDAFIAVAAVADYTPSTPAGTKIKKKGAPLTITLRPTVDILATVAAHRIADSRLRLFALHAAAGRRGPAAAGVEDPVPGPALQRDGWVGRLYQRLFQGRSAARGVAGKDEPGHAPGRRPAACGRASGARPEGGRARRKRLGE